MGWKKARPLDSSAILLISKQPYEQRKREMGRLKQIGIDVDVHRSIEQARQSFSESENDILRRLLLGEAALRRSALPKRSRIIGLEDAVRSRGLWSVDVKGERISAANMKEAYRTLLLKLDEVSPNFIERFASERARSRRFVARKPTDLYDSSPHLADEYAQPLKDGWYYDTNLSTEQVAKRARVAARVAGLSYGREVRLLDNLREV
jgi:hypothetical protein